MLVDGDGDYSHKERKTEELAWLDVPKWSTDLNLAWELLKQFPATIEYPAIAWTGTQAKFFHALQLGVSLTNVQSGATF